MRRARGVLTILIVTTIALLTAWPAAAGGPTSVLLVAPGTGRTASLYTTDADYRKLSELVGAERPSEGGGAVDRSGASHDVGTPVTLTWLVHDVDVWRVDRVYLDAEGGPWISTQSNGGEGTVWDAPVVWHTSADGRQLASLLDRLGVTLPSPPAGGDAVTGASAQAPEADPAAASSDTSDPAAGDATTPSRGELTWAVIGLVLGAALTLAGVRRFSTARATGDRPDAEPAEDGAGDTGHAPARPDESNPSLEELSPSPWAGR